MNSATTSVAQVIEQFTNALESAIRREIDAKVEVALSRMQPPAAVPAPVPSHASVTASAPTGKRVRLCPVAGCGLPAAGPKYGWRCREHGAAYRARAVAAASTVITEAPPAPKAPLIVSLPVPKAATVIPPNVTIKRLPAGPAPRSEKRRGPPTNCRLPGCLMRNSGPRYDFFCRDHYAVLSKDERAKYAALARGQGL